MLDFVFVGPMKTGTSWVHEFLASHKEVNVPATVKETYYFSKNYHRGEQWFDGQFRNPDEFKVRGEVGPTYFPNAEVAELVKKHSPDAKIIIMLREPYARFVSHYYHNLRAGFIEKGTRFDVAYKSKRGVRSHSEYFNNVTSWQRVFGNNQVKILLYEDLKFRPEFFARDICKNLNVEHGSIPDSLGQKVGERREPRNALVLRSASNAAKHLRRLDMHSVVNLSKMLGLRGMLYSKSDPVGDKIEGSEEVFSILQQDSIRLKRDVGIDISHWESIWKTRQFQ